MKRGILDEVGLSDEAPPARRQWLVVVGLLLAVAGVLLLRPLLPLSVALMMLVTSLLAAALFGVFTFATWLNMHGAPKPTSRGSVPAPMRPVLEAKRPAIKVLASSQRGLPSGETMTR